MATSKQKQFTWISLTLLLVCYIWFGWYLCGIPSKPMWLNSVCYRVLGTPVPATPMGTTNPAVEAPTIAPNTTMPQSAPQGSESSRSPSPAPSPISTQSPTGSPAESRSPAPATQNDTAKQPDKAANPSASNPFSRSLCSTVFKYNLFAGLLAIGWILLSSMIFISPITSFSAFISRWFQSDTVAFASVFLAAALAAVILYWLHIFMQILTILTVDALARIDIQYLGLTGYQVFWILTLTSFVGLTIGWTAHAVL